MMRKRDGGADLLEPHPHVLCLEGRRVIGWHEFGQQHNPVATVLYCHGTPGTGYEALFFHEAARRMGIRIIAIDRPGLGSSDRVEFRWIDTWVRQDVVAVVEHLELKRFAVMGFSGGGPHAMGIASILKPQVEQVALLMPYTYHPLWESCLGLDLTAFRVHLSHLLLSWFPKGAIDATARWAGRRGTEASPLGEALTRDVLGRTAAYRMAIAHDYALQFSVRGGVQDEYAIQRRWGFSETSLSAPVHVWVAGADQAIRPARARNLGLRLGAQIHELPRDGHFSLLINHAESVLAPLRAATSVSDLGA